MESLQNIQQCMIDTSPNDAYVLRREIHLSGFTAQCK